MWRGTFLFASLAALLAQSAAAQESPTAGEKLRLQKYLRLHVSGGRIEARPGEAGHSRTVTTGHPESASWQQLQLQVRPPCVVVQYEALEPGGRLLLRLCDKRNLVIERTFGDPSALAGVRYEQPLAGPVKLIVAGRQTEQYEAQSLWHLALIHPHECREHLFPLLASLATDWDLARQAEELESALIAAVTEADVASDERSWGRLVDALGSEQFSRRQAADAALRQEGQGAAAFLSRLDARSMSAEQRRRVERIRQSYADGASDTPPRMAAWLLGDRKVWLALLDREDLAVRQAAAEQLSRLMGRQLSFDPQADEKTRQVQLAELSRRIGSK